MPDISNSNSGRQWALFSFPGYSSARFQFPVAHSWFGNSVNIGREEGTSCGLLTPSTFTLKTRELRLNLRTEWAHLGVLIIPRRELFHVKGGTLRFSANLDKWRFCGIVICIWKKNVTLCCEPTLEVLVTYVNNYCVCTMEMINCHWYDYKNGGLSNTKERSKTNPSLSLRTLSKHRLSVMGIQNIGKMAF